MTDKYIKTNIEGLVKEPSSQAILNVDNQRLEAYKRQRALLSRSVDATKRIESVEKDVSQIKEMLQLLLEKIDNK